MLHLYFWRGTACRQGRQIARTSGCAPNCNILEISSMLPWSTNLSSVGLKGLRINALYLVYVLDGIGNVGEDYFSG